MHPARPPRHANTTPSPSLQSLQCACKVSRSSETHSQSYIQHPDLRPNLGQIQLTSSRCPTQTSVLPNPFQNEFHISPKPPPALACKANRLPYPIVRPPLLSSARVQTRSRARSDARPVNTSFDAITPACTPHVPQDTPTPPRPLLYRACSVPAKFRAHRKPTARVMSNSPTSVPTLVNYLLTSSDFPNQHSVLQDIFQRQVVLHPTCPQVTFRHQPLTVPSLSPPAAHACVLLGRLTHLGRSYSCPHILALGLTHVTIFLFLLLVLHLRFQNWAYDVGAPSYRAPPANFKESSPRRF